MIHNHMAQLQELARNDVALRHALDAANSPIDLIGLASLHNLELSESAAQAWLDSRAVTAPTSEMLGSISKGLSASEVNEAGQILSDEDLESIAGGWDPNFTDENMFTVG